MVYRHVVVRLAIPWRVLDLVTRCGESVQIRRVVRLQPVGALSAYVHGNGRIAAVVDVSNAKVEDFGRKLAMPAANLHFPKADARAYEASWRGVRCAAASWMPPLKSSVPSCRRSAARRIRWMPTPSRSG